MLNGSVSEPAAAAPRQRPGRVVAWSALGGLRAAVAYAGRLSDGELPDDLLYLWSTFAGALIQYAIMFALILAIARGLDRRLLGLEAPARRGRAVGLAFVALVVIVGASVEP